MTGNTDPDVPTSVSLSALYLRSFSWLYCCDGGGKGHHECLIIAVVVPGTEDLSIRNQCLESAGMPRISCSPDCKCAFKPELFVSPAGRAGVYG